MKLAAGRKRSSPGVLVIVDRLDAEPGAEVTFDKVLLVETEAGDIVTGTPYVAGASVTGVVEARRKGKKIRVFKMKRRKQYRRRPRAPHAADARAREGHHV